MLHSVWAAVYQVKVGKFTQKIDYSAKMTSFWVDIDVFNLQACLKFVHFCSGWPIN